MPNENDTPNPRENAETPRGPVADPLPGHEKADPRTGGGQPQEDVEDRPMVGQVTPEDYVDKKHDQSAP